MLEKIRNCRKIVKKRYAIYCLVKFEGAIYGDEKMFGKRKKVESVTVVTTKEQLKAAVNRKDVCIEIKGELAGKMKWMAKLSKKKVAIIITCLTSSAVVPAVAPVAGIPAAASAVAPVAAGIGATEAACVISVVGIMGAVGVVAMFKNYDMEFKAGSNVLRLTANK